VPHVPAEDLKRFALRLGIDPEAAWQAEHCGPLTRRYWELHTRDQLVAMIRDELGGPLIVRRSPDCEVSEREWKQRADVVLTWNKSLLVEELLELRPAESVRIDKPERGLPMPRELRPDRRGGPARHARGRRNGGEKND
jgi:hypothetical protein